MSAKKREQKKKNYSEWVHANVNALRANANECKKKRRKKKKLTWNGSMQTGMRCVWMVLHADGLACGWCCVRMVLHADGVVCGWCCVRMVLHADGLYGDVDGGSCRDGGRG